jgi:hypothetical protein
LRLEFSDFAQTSHAATVLSASLQLFGCLSGLVWHYLHFMTEHLRLLVDRGGIGSEHVQFGMGITVFLEFLLLSPLSWCLVYFFMEGGVRLWAVLITGEVVGTLPLKLADKLYLYCERRSREKDLPPLVEDEIVLIDSDTYIVNSCREKDWDLSTAVRIDELLYAVVEIEVADGVRPYGYRLRPFPQDRIVRKVRDLIAPLPDPTLPLPLR